MIIKEKGTIKVLMEEQTGTSKAGNAWQSREFVIEVREENFITPVHFKAFGRDVDDLRSASVGDEVEVSYKPQAREYNGKWYDENRLYGIRNLTKNGAPKTAAAPKVENSKLIDDDIPF